MSDQNVGPYDELLVALDTQYDKTARFIRAAFHVHSIDSYDWGKEADPATNAKDQFTGPEGQDRFLDALASAGLELVCITDHMKSGYACELAQRATTRAGVAVLPGMEISCAFGANPSEHIHVLVVFPLGTTPDVIERIFGAQTLPGGDARTGQEVARFATLEELRRHVHAAGGLFLLAHIDQQPRGHRCHIRSARGDTAKMFAIDPAGAPTITDISNEYASYLAELDPDAVEVMKSADRAHYYRFTTPDGREHGVPCVARSDHHSIESLATADAVTHLKVSRRDLRCVRDALTFRDTRVRFSDDLPPSPSPRLVGLRLRGGGLFGDATIAFNENLNCLIGARGSGKSTIVEALRYVLGQTPLLERAARGAGDEHSYATLALATQAANLRDSEIELVYQRGDERHVLTATYDTGTRVFTLDGDDAQVPAEALETAYPARIFSWGELETLGRQPRLQRVVVDRLAEDLPDLRAQMEAAQEALRENRREVGALRERLASLLTADSGALRRFAEYKTAFERLNTEAVQALFAELDRRRERISLLDAIAADLEQLLRRAQQLADEDPGASVDDLLAGASEDLRAWWATTASSSIDLETLVTTVHDRAAAIVDVLAERQGVVETLAAGERASLEEAEASLREQTRADPGAAVQRDQREQARTRFESASSLRDGYLETYSRLQAALDHRGDLVSRVSDAAAAITAARQTIADELGQRLSDIGREGMTITIDVTPGGDRDAWIDYLKEDFLNQQRAGQYVARQVARRLGNSDPATIVTAILEQTPDALASQDTEQGLSSEEAERLVGAFAIFLEDQEADVTRVAEELDEVLALHEQPIDDLVRIQSDGAPVDQLSPGGRSSAMLPLIALSDDVPLIIDQPEDNLDNRMVGQTLSSILARLKERRQIIVTTHNPNIVVGGDAEQVAVLEAPSAQAATIGVTGSIDDDDVIDAVISIMEGGAEAFEERAVRYEPHLR